METMQTEQEFIETDEARENLPEDIKQQIITLCGKRAATYEFISRLFKVEVDEDTYASLRKAAFPARTGNANIDLGYRKLATYLSNDHDDVLLQLAVDYVRIFIGHGNTAYSAAYPFESVYTSEKRLLMENAREEITDAYAEAGLVITKDWKDPEDHIALELEYMQIMARRAKELLEAGKEDEALACMTKQKAFLIRHIASWVPMMTSDMRRFAQTDFYLGLSYIAEGFIAQDRSFLSDLIED